MAIVLYFPGQLLAAYRRQHQQLKKHMIWQVLKIAVAIALVGLVLSQVSVESLAALEGRISLPWFLASILAFYAAIWLMTRRYWVLLGTRVAFEQLLDVVLFQTIAGNMVATSAGFASYVGILRNKYKVQVSYGLTSAVLAKFGDLLALLLALMFASWAVWPKIATLHVTVMLVIFCMIAFVILFSLILLLRQRLVVVLDRILRRLHLDRKSSVQRALGTLVAISDHEIGQPGLIVGPFVGYSFLILGMMLLFAYCSLQMFAVRIDMWPIIFVSSLALVIAHVPIQVFGGLGLSDVTYLYLYGLFGVDRSELAAVVVGLRLFFYLTNLLLLPLILLRTWWCHNPETS